VGHEGQGRIQITGDVCRGSAADSDRLESVILKVLASQMLAGRIVLSSE
jgi:hypothetical protein